jgi:hypothetical protein
MRIYVAGASSEIERARRVIAALRAEGHEITFDWTVDFEANETLLDVQRGAYADADFQGVSMANRVVLLIPAPPNLTQGAWWEGGVADALEIPIIASGRPEHRAKNIFLSHALEVDTDEEAIELCREDDVLRRLQEQGRELAHYRRRVEELEQGIRSLSQRLDGGISKDESEALYAQILAKRL